MWHVASAAWLRAWSVLLAAEIEQPHRVDPAAYVVGVPNDLKAVAAGIQPQHQQGRRLQRNRYALLFRMAPWVVRFPFLGVRLTRIGAEVFYCSWAANLDDAVLPAIGTRWMKQ